MTSKGMQSRGNIKNRASNSRGKKKPRIVKAKNKNLYLAIFLWRLRWFRGKVYYIGYRLYPVYIFILGGCTALYVESLYYNIPIIMRLETLHTITAITSILLVYYTYKWLSWKWKVKKYYRQRMKAISPPRSNTRRRQVSRTRYPTTRMGRRRTDVVTSYMVVPKGRSKHGTR